MRRRSGTEIAPDQITTLILIDMGLAACWLLHILPSQSVASHKSVIATKSVAKKLEAKF
jgi:hypothetical protein